MIASLGYHFEYDIRELYEAENNLWQHQGGGMNRQNNNRNDDHNPPPPPDNVENRNPPINLLGNWQNVLPDDVADHPVIRAFLASNSSFLVTDPRLPGNPIIYASPGFLNLTLYPVHRVLGRNCRFLQGPETDPVAVSQMREAIDNGEDVSVRLLNYRYDGTTFVNEVIVSGIRDDAGDVLYYLGLQFVVVPNNDADDDQENNDRAEVSASDDSSS